MSSIVRSYAREIARRKLKAEGYSRIRVKEFGAESWSEFFHRVWRQFSSWFD